jgi:hypothetical protein
MPDAVPREIHPLFSRDPISSRHYHSLLIGGIDGISKERLNRLMVQLASVGSSRDRGAALRGFLEHGTTELLP